MSVARVRAVPASKQAEAGGHQPGERNSSSPFLSPGLNRAVRNCEGLQLANKPERQRQINVYVSARRHFQTQRRPNTGDLLG